MVREVIKVGDVVRIVKSNGDLYHWVCGMLNYIGKEAVVKTKRVLTGGIMFTLCDVNSPSGVPYTFTGDDLEKVEV